MVYAVRSTGGGAKNLPACKAAKVWLWNWPWRKQCFSCGTAKVLCMKPSMPCRDLQNEARLSQIHAPPQGQKSDSTGGSNAGGKSGSPTTPAAEGQAQKDPRPSKKEAKVWPWDLHAKTLTSNGEEPEVEGEAMEDVGPVVEEADPGEPVGVSASVPQKSTRLDIEDDAQLRNDTQILWAQFAETRLFFQNHLGGFAGPLTHTAAESVDSFLRGQKVARDPDTTALHRRVEELEKRSEDEFFQKYPDMIPDAQARLDQARAELAQSSHPETEGDRVKWSRSLLLARKAWADQHSQGSFKRNQGHEEYLTKSRLCTGWLADCVHEYQAMISKVAERHEMILQRHEDTHHMYAERDAEIANIFEGILQSAKEKDPESYALAQSQVYPKPPPMTENQQERTRQDNELAEYMDRVEASAISKSVWDESEARKL